ncbi:MAG TPA: transglutaminase family protein [Chloroflexota bacterium]
MIVSIVHTTTFDYSDDISESAMEVRLAPASNERQVVRSHVLHVTPRVKLLPYTDYFGTTVQFFTVPSRYRRLSVVSTSVVETLPANPFLLPEPDAEEPEAPGALYDYLRFGGPVGRHPELVTLAAAFRDERPLLERLTALNQTINRRLDYRPLVTQVDSALDDVLALGQGVCQDFAHLMIGVCRELGVPARYVSGYLYTPPSANARGSGASHAWCECYLPGVGWKGFDPTNDLLVDDQYVQIATGRDYRDVPPTKGIYRGSAQEVISVSVRTEKVEPQRGGARNIVI